MTKEEKTKILSINGLEEIYFPKKAIFGKTIENDFYTIELQIQFDENMNFVSIDVNTFISEISSKNEDNINNIYESYIQDLEEIKKVHKELIKLF